MQLESLRWFHGRDIPQMSNRATQGDLALHPQWTPQIHLLNWTRHNTQQNIQISEIDYTKPKKTAERHRAMSDSAKNSIFFLFVFAS